MPFSSKSSRLSESKPKSIHSSSSTGSKRLPILPNKLSSLSSQDGSTKIGKICLNGQKKEESISHDLPKYVHPVMCFCAFASYIM